jgi:RNA polymerase sigma-70 factor (ECF subfamily)
VAKSSPTSNGAARLVLAPGGQPRVVFDFTITNGVIVAIDLIANRERLRRLDLAVLDD